MRRYRERNPVAYAYSNLKQNARRRGKDFSLTLAEFEEFCTATNYLKGSGRSATCYHVDRIDETKGYSRDNIQLLTNAENSRKYVRFTYHYNFEEGQMEFDTSVNVKAPISDNDCPF